MNAGRFFERRRVAISWGFALLYLVMARPQPVLLAAGALFLTAGAVVRTWASGHIRKQEALAVSGPYAHTRNPLYLGSFLMALGALIMGGNWWIVALFTASAVPLYVTVMRREEKFLEERFGDSFRRYQQSVPLFLPRLRPYSGGGGDFQWGLVSQHREWRVWAGAVGVTLLMTLKYYWL